MERLIDIIQDYINFAWIGAFYFIFILVRDAIVLINLPEVHRLFLSDYKKYFTEFIKALIGSVFLYLLVLALSVFKIIELGLSGLDLFYFLLFLYIFTFFIYLYPYKMIVESLIKDKYNFYIEDSVFTKLYIIKRVEDNQMLLSTQTKADGHDDNVTIIYRSIDDVRNSDIKRETAHRAIVWRIVDNIVDLFTSAINRFFGRYINRRQ